MLRLARWLEYPLYALIIAVGLILTSAIVLATWFDIDNYRADIEAWFQTRTGYQLKLNGDINYSLWAPLQLDAEAIQVYTPDNGLLLDLPRLELSLEIEEIWHGQLRAKRLIVTRPRLQLDSTRLAVLKALWQGWQNRPEQWLSQLDIERLEIRSAQLSGEYQQMPLDIAGLNLQLLDWQAWHSRDVSAAPRFSLAANAIEAKILGLPFEDLVVAAVHSGTHLDLHRFESRLWNGVISLNAHFPWQLDSRATIHQLSLSQPYLHVSDVDQLLAVLHRLPIEHWRPRWHTITIKKLQLKDANLDWQSDQLQLSLSRLQIEANNLPLLIDGLPQRFPPRFDEVGQLRLQADQLMINRQPIHALDGLFGYNPEAVNLINLTADMPYGKGSASGRLALNDQRAAASLNLDLNGLELAMFNTPATRFNASGRLDLEATLTTQLAQPHHLLKALNGSILIGGQFMNFKQHALDVLLFQILDGRERDLSEIGNYALLGPLSILADKALDIDQLGQLPNAGETDIERLHARFELASGYASFADVAYRTPHHRIAAHGGIDLVEERWDELEMAILTRRGCAAATVRLNGERHQPNAELIDYQSGKRFDAQGLEKERVAALKPAQCTPFYDGSISHPN